MRLKNMKATSEMLRDLLRDLLRESGVGAPCLKLLSVALIEEKS